MNNLDFIDNKIKDFFSQINCVKTIRFKPVWIVNDEDAEYISVLTDIQDTTYNRGLATYRLRTYVLDKMEQDGTNPINIWDRTEQILVKGISKLLYEFNQDSEFTINYVTDELNDIVAGVYTDWVISLPQPLC